MAERPALGVGRIAAESSRADLAERADVRERLHVHVHTVYVTLVRLEKQGLVRSWRSDPESVRGGKAKRHFELTRTGALALERVREEAARMWEGLDPAPRSAARKEAR